MAVVTLFGVPQPVEPAANARMRLYVCQASYGDTLALDIDATPPQPLSSDPALRERARLTSNSRHVILIDGGPATTHATGRASPQHLPVYYLLPCGGNKLDTVVVTHDDSDHMTGISELLWRLMEFEESYLWPQGTRNASQGVAPFANIWHNSAQSIVENYKLIPKRLEYEKKQRLAQGRGEYSSKAEDKVKKGDKGDKTGDRKYGEKERDEKRDKERSMQREILEEAELKKPGYFDNALKAMRIQWGQDAVPRYNKEFATPDNPPELKNLVQNGLTTRRGHVQFEFLGPSQNELKGLADFFTSHPSTAGSNGPMVVKTVESKNESERVKDLAELAEFNKKRLTNDPSKKNLSSIVFIARIPPRDGFPEWSGLFTGDASAQTIFSVKENMKQLPLELDLLKVGHHGSLANNFFGPALMKQIVAQNERRTRGEENGVQAEVPRVKDIDQALTGDAHKPPTILLGHILAYFCNVRAKNYVISASHDRHPNPHISNIIGIITRAVLYPQVRTPETEPVRIYMTNPLPKVIWQKILTYWFAVKKSENGKQPHKGPIPDADKLREFWEFDAKTHGQQLQEMLDLDLKGEEPEDQDITDSTWKPFFYGPDNPIFQFYVLGPDSPYGQFIAGPILGDNMWDADQRNQALLEPDWVPISPMADWSDAWLHFHYQEDFRGLTTGQTVPLKPQTVQRLQDDEKDFRDYCDKQHQGDVRWLIDRYDKAPLLAPQNSPAYDQEETAIYNDFAGMGEHQIRSDWNGQNDGGGQMHMMAVLEDMPDYDNTDAKTETRAESTSFNDEKNAKWQLPIARRANYEAFRRFDIEEYDIPPSDDFAAMAQMKLKHISSFRELLVYLVASKNLTRQDAINASIKGCISSHPTLSGLPTLGALAYLILGIDGSDCVLKTLPLNFVRDTKLLSSFVANPLQWPVHVLDVVVYDYTTTETILKNGSGIQQMSWRILPPDGRKAITWEVPNHSQRLGRGRFFIHIAECIDVTIYWPTDPKRRTVHGRFVGTVPLRMGQAEHPIVGEWLVLPGNKRPVTYNIQFSNSEFKTKDVSMNIVDMVAAFGGVEVNLSIALAQVLLPDVFGRDNPLDDNIKFSDAGFIIRRELLEAMDLSLHGVYGKFSLVDIPDWTPFAKYAGREGLEGFLGKIRIPTPTLRLCLQDFFRSTGIKTFFRINHSIKIDDSDFGYEFQTRPGPHGGRLWEFTFLPRSINTKSPLTIEQILATFGLAPAHGDVPDFLTDALSSTSISSFRLGWKEKMGARLPDYLELSIRVESFDIAGGFINIDNVTVRLRIDNIGSKETRNVYIQSGGVVHLVGIEHMASFTYGHHPALLLGSGDSKGKMGPVNLAIHASDTPLTLGAILTHFWPDTQIFPDYFSGVVNEVGLREFSLNTAYSESNKGQVVEMMRIGLGVTSTEIKILDGLYLIEPSLEITAFYPGDQKLRTFMVDFSSMVMIDEYFLNVNVGLIAGMSSSFCVTLRSGADGYPVGAFLKFVTRKTGRQFDIPYPESFGPLDTTYINELAIIVGNGDQGKYTIQSFSITAWSDLQLDLWDKPPVVLDKVTLNAAYSSTTGFNFDFGAQLNINEHVLFTTVSYGTLPYGGISDGDGERNRNAQSSGWSITATYAGDIDLLAIVKRLTLLDIASEVSNMNIRNVDASKDKGITLSNLTLSIQKSKSGGAIYIAADTEWSVFQHIEFAATFYGTGSWGFSLTMELQDDLLSLIPVDFIKEFSDYVKVNDTLVAFYVGKVQPQEAGPTKPRQPPRPGSRSIGPASTVDLALAVSTKLQMTDKFGVIKEWIGAGELEIDGYISTKSVGLGAKIPKKIQLCRDEDTGKYDIEITGSIAVAAGPGFEIALNADMDINCPLVTKNLIMFRNTGFVLNANGALGFQGKIASTLTDIFGIDGLEASGLSVKALFSLAQSGVPEELSLTGRLSLQGAGGLNSEIALYFAQHNLAGCYFYGKLENLDIQVLVSYILKKHGIPAVAADFIDANAGIRILELEAALQKMVVRELKNKEVQPGFYYEADLFIKVGSWEWRGYSCIEARMGGLQFIWAMTPLSFSESTETFFKISRGALKASDYLSDASRLQKKLSKEMWDDGPIIYITSNDPNTPLFLSGRLKLLGFGFEVNAVGNRDGFSFDVEGYAGGIGALGFNGEVKGNATVLVKPNQLAAAHLALSLSLTLSLPTINIEGFGQKLSLPSSSLTLVSFGIGIGVQIGWPKSGYGLQVNFQYNVCVFNENHSFSIDLELTAEELDSLYKIVENTLRDFRSRFENLIINMLGGKGVQEVVTFVKDKFEQAGQHLVTAASILTSTVPESVISEIGVKALGLSGQVDVIDVLKNFYGDASKVQELSARLLGVPIGGFPGIPQVPKLPDFLPDLPVIPDLPSIPSPGDIIGSIRLPWGMAADMLSEGAGPGDTTGLASKGLVPVVLVTMPTMSDDNGGAEPKMVPLLAAVPAQQADDALTWTQAQVNEYVREQRIGFVKSTLQFFTPEEVFESSKSMFADLSADEVRIYIAEAGGELKGVED